MKFKLKVGDRVAVYRRYIGIIEYISSDYTNLIIRYEHPEKENCRDVFHYRQCFRPKNKKRRTSLQEILIDEPLRKALSRKPSTKRKIRKK